ncbi:MAG: hypothetical protein H5T74_03085 [Actinobacteria bacterium]|nr:hypothetical protein [Actinomycetota bacterium]MDI6830078.1 CocE/NonD family hydrolase [Actinomycetota bacterium]
MRRERIYFYADSLEPIRLEGILELPEGGSRPPACILCHPHPIGGGSMDVPLMEVLSKVLSERGWACLRFNFRGVGRSGGVSTGGIRETEDLEGAWAWLREREDVDAWDLSVAGWSFGAWVGLRWAVKGDRCRRVALISPPLVGFDFFTFLEEEGVSLPSRCLVVAGERDQFADRERLERLSSRLGAALRLLPGADHFLFGREREVAEAVGDHWAAG